MRAETHPVVDESPAELVYGAFNVFAYTPAMPGIAYRVRDHLLGTQEPGGRCITTEEDIAPILRVHRSQVGRGLLHLQLARMVLRHAKGVYQLNPMISGFRTLAELKQAVDALPQDLWLDVEDYQERYDQAVAAYEEEKRLRALERRQGTSASVEGVADLTAVRRTRRS